MSRNFFNCFASKTNRNAFILLAIFLGAFLLSTSSFANMDDFDFDEELSETPKKVGRRSQVAPTWKNVDEVSEHIVKKIKAMHTEQNPNLFFHPRITDPELQTFTLQRAERRPFLEAAKAFYDIVEDEKQGGSDIGAFTKKLNQLPPLHRALLLKYIPAIAVFIGASTTVEAATDIIETDARSTSPLLTPDEVLNGSSENLLRHPIMDE